MSEWLRGSFSQKEVELKPGGPAQHVAFMVENLGDNVRGLMLAVELFIEGRWVYSPGWISATPEVFTTIYPLDRTDVEEDLRRGVADIQLIPPADLDWKGGSHPARVKVTTQETQQVDYFDFTLRLPLAYDLELNLEPVVQSGEMKGEFLLTVANKGNTDVKLSLNPDSDNLDLSLSTASLALPENKSAEVTVIPKAHEPLYQENPRKYKFSVILQLENSPEVPPWRIDGTWYQKPSTPSKPVEKPEHEKKEPTPTSSRRRFRWWWILIGLSIICLVVIGAIVLGSNQDPPRVSFEPSGSYNDCINGITFKINISDNEPVDVSSFDIDVNGVKYQIDYGACNEILSKRNYYCSYTVPKTDGAVVYRFEGHDRDGNSPLLSGGSLEGQLNEGFNPENFSVSISPPILQWQSLTSQDSIVFVAEAKDGCQVLDRIDILIDGETVESYRESEAPNWTSRTSDMTLLPGEHTYQARAYDQAGNVYETKVKQLNIGY